MYDRELLYAVWLTSCMPPNASATYKAVRRFPSAEAVFNASPEDFGADFSPRELAFFADKSLKKAIAALDSCALYNIKVIPFSSDEYPIALRSLDEPPCALFVRGKLDVSPEKPATAIVGTRKATEKGKHFAANVAYELSLAGVTVVSGMAKGIDTYAHKGALLAGKPTVAVVAGGVEHVYPKENYELYTHIINCGAVISEYAPDTKIDPYMFHMRNRIISALSNGVLVVESAEGGGSMITVRHALDQGRTVFAVPGAVDSEVSKGTNALIKDGATAVTCAQDIIDELNLYYEGTLKIPEKKRSERRASPSEQVNISNGKSGHKAERKKEPEKEKTVSLPDENGLSEKEKKVLRVIRENAPCSVDTLCDLAKMSFSEAVPVISSLELSDIIFDTGGGRYSVQ